MIVALNLSGQVSGIPYIRTDFVINTVAAVIGFVFLCLMIISNLDSHQRLAFRKPRLTSEQFRRRCLNLRLRWATTYFFLGAEAFACYRVWALWHYQWTNLPYEVVFFDAFRLSGFIILAVFWFLDARR